MSARPVPPPSTASMPPTDAEICSYIAELCAELRHLARRPRLRTIDYLLDMVRLESERMAKDFGAAAAPHDGSRGVRTGST